MKFLVDESVDGYIVDALRENGYRVAYVAEMAPGISDVEVLHQANRTQAILVTADKDFGEIVYRQGKVTYGILLIRMSGMTAEEKINITIKTIKIYATKLIRNFSVLTDKNLRIRSPNARL